MSFSRWNSAIRRTLWGIPLFMAVSSAALADTTTLVCDVPPSDRVIFYGVPTIDLNEVQGTVTIHYPSWRSSRGGSTFEEKTLGPIPANFGAETITIPPVEVPGFSLTKTETINRVTGFFSLNQWTCHAARKQF